MAYNNEWRNNELETVVKDIGEDYGKLFACITTS